MADQSGHVTGYPAPGYPNPPAHPSSNPNGYPPAHNSYSSTAPGTAYAYAAPPPQPGYYNPNPYHAPPYSSQRATFIRRFLAVLIASFIIAGTIVFIVWLVLRPRLPEFRVDSVTVSNFNVSTASNLISGDWDVRFTVLNPNHKMKLHYDHVESAVYYNSAAISETTVAPFDQETKNQTAVRATFSANSAYIEGAASDLNQDRSRGRVDFNVRLLARVRFKAGAWQARRRFLRVYCGDLTVGMRSNSAGGTLIGGPKQCRVGL